MSREIVIALQLDGCRVSVQRARVNRHGRPSR
jgi:hypothetical protein